MKKSERVSHSVVSVSLQMYESFFFPTVSFIKSKHKSGTSAEILLSKLRYTVSIKYTLDSTET